MKIIILEVTETESGALKFCPSFCSGNTDVVIALPAGCDTVILEKEEKPWQLRIFATDM